MSDEPRWAAVILAAGYGSRLQKDIETDPSKQFGHLLGQPKALLPVGGVPLLDHWLRIFRETSAQVGGFILAWARDARVRIGFYRGWIEGCVCVCGGGGASQNSEKVADQPANSVHHFLSNLRSPPPTHTPAGSARSLWGLAPSAEGEGRHDRGQGHPSGGGGHPFFPVTTAAVVVIDFSLSFFLSSLPSQHSGVVTYQIGSDAETLKRGLVEVDASGQVIKLLEKPEPTATSSRSACPAFYAYRHNCKALIGQFLEENKDAPLEMKDAPGQLLAWLLQRVPVQAIPVSGRFDIGNLSQYRDTLSFYAQTLDSELKPHHGAGVVVGRACARAALAGNPSDGFGGKTVSLLVTNYAATVTMRPSERLVFVPHPEYDKDHEFTSMGELLLTTELNGYYGEHEFASMGELLLATEVNG
ncbi:hypothetical protein T492DRAFT_850291 [Pavlovales sp. CCMP2436]|nr:hypothetical protein T492DRAFT_850291 [Pavlovales sp. CCMP2436]